MNVGEGEAHVLPTPNLSLSTLSSLSGKDFVDFAEINFFQMQPPVSIWWKESQSTFL